MTHALTLAAVKKMNPCSGDFRRISKLLKQRRRYTAAQAVEAGCTFDDLMWITSAAALEDKLDSKK